MRNNAGSTLIEFILYIALLSIIMSGLIRFGWDIVYTRIKSNTGKEVTYNLRLISKRILFEIRNASAVNSVSGSSICLANTDSTRNPTRLYLSSGALRIAWGGGSVNCTSMTNDEALTGNKVTVSHVSFARLTNGTTTENIKFSITLNHVNPSSRNEWSKTQSYSSAVELRSN